jgi:signal transduction histidine kinase
MEGLSLPFFPFPYVRGGERHDGYLASWPQRCLTCDRRCERSRPSADVALCDFGVNYAWFSDDVLVAGIVVIDFPALTEPRRKMLRKGGPSKFRSADVLRAKETFLRDGEEYLAARRQGIERASEEYRGSEAFFSELVSRLRPDIEKALSQVHDYRQFVTQIIQNLNVILERRHPNLPIEGQLQRATTEEVAIYRAARLMEEKLEAALFLLYPERITDPGSQSSFRLHGLVHKYRKIYDPSFEAKNIRVLTKGSTYANVYGNTKALGVIVHTFIDNAKKYAPRGTDVTLGFEELDRVVRFSVTSHGPEIRDDERNRIFEPFYRGLAAQHIESEGTGFGLALTRAIADWTGVTLTVDQDRSDVIGDCYRTYFAADFPRYPGRSTSNGEDPPSNP